MEFDAESRFGQYISLINRAAQGYFYRELKGYNIGPGQQAYLLALFPGEKIPQEELARRLKVDKANVTRAVKALEVQEYIARERHGSDGRSRLISLTPLGIETRREIEEIARLWVEKLKAPLKEEEWAGLNAALEKIAESID